MGGQPYMASGRDGRASRPFGQPAAFAAGRTPSDGRALAATAARPPPKRLDETCRGLGPSTPARTSFA